MSKRHLCKCGKEITKKSIRCKSCSNRNRKGLYKNRVENRIGIKAPNWKGGRSNYYYRKLKKKELCERCNSKRFLDIHHKDYNHHNNDINNLQVLCKSCHLKEDYKNGVRIGRSKSHV